MFLGEFLLPSRFCNSAIFVDMEAIQISGIFKSAICRAIPIEDNLYRITKDTVFIGKILKENGGWSLEEVAGEDLTAENVQLIGAYLDRKRR